MKRVLLPLCTVSALILCVGIVAAGQMPGHAGHEHAMETAAGSNHSNLADVVKHPACFHCGMDRKQFAHSRMLITYADGSTAGVCSIHCAVTELKTENGMAVTAVEVADLNSKKLIDADTATWVIGGSRRGVMTRTPKWAFAKKDDAAAFISKNGGKQATYKEALALAETD